jgi:hypothetical protein
MSLEGMYAIDDMWDWAPKRDRKNPDKRAGNHPAVTEEAQTQQAEPALSWPTNVQDGFIEAGVRLHDLTQEMKHPEKLPDHISPEQARFTIDRAMALIQQRTEASTRQFIISSVPLVVDKIHTNSTNGHGTNGHNTNGHSNNGTNGHHPIPLVSPAPERALAASKL